MSRNRLSEVYLPAYVDLSPLRRMKKVAGKIAMAKKALAELSSVEQQLLAGAGGISEEDLRLGKSEMVRFAKIIAKNTKEAAIILKVLRKDAMAYRKELLDAAG